jgi:Protein of unknown function (DUF1207)
MEKMKNTMRVFFLSIIGMFMISPAYSELKPNDSYIAGYATGLLKRDFELDLSTLVVRDGIITLPAHNLTPQDRIQVRQLLSEIPGVNGIELQISDSQRDIAVYPPPDTDKQDNIVANNPLITNSEAFPTGFLPTGHLFKPLLADPRWAHFSASYRNYVGTNIDGNNNASVSFGETIPFYRSNLGKTTMQWEAGLQAAVFSDFNLDASSSDLINSDFIGSVYSSMRMGQFSAFARVFHQSSHLGDEFLLRTSLERINLSYEGADLRLSYELPYGIRVYGGGGGIFHKHPSTIKPWSVQYGLEFRSPWRFDFAAIRPILAIDFKNHEQSNWDANISARAGIQFDNHQVFSRKLQFLIEYFNGNSPTGQFYKEKAEYLGIGAHYHF